MVATIEGLIPLYTQISIHTLYKITSERGQLLYMYKGQNAECQLCPLFKGFTVRSLEGTSWR